MKGMDGSNNDFECFEGESNFTYKAGQGYCIRFTCICENTVLGNYYNSYLGYGMKNTSSSSTITSSVFVGIDSVSDSICVRYFNADNETMILQANFNLDTLNGNGNSGLTLDHLSINIFEISVGYLGSSNNF